MKNDYDDIAAKITRRAYKYLGKGSGRRVFDMGNGYVIKVAKNKKGIAQNEAEHKMVLDTEADLFAKVVSASEDFKYVIMEKAERVQRMNYIWKHFNAKNNKEFYQTINLKGISNKYGLTIADFGRASNWGLINGIPVIVDYGLTNTVFKKYYVNERIKSLFLLLIGL